MSENILLVIKEKTPFKEENYTSTWCNFRIK